MPVKPIAVNLPYPSTDGLLPDQASAKIIAPAYAAAHSETTAILQYVYHSFWFGEVNRENDKALVEGIAICEMHHLEILGNALLKLGVDPKFVAEPPAPTHFYNTSAVSYSKTPVKMLLDDVAGEMGAIKGYESMLRRLKNEAVAAIIQRILLDEYLHLDRLRAAFSELSPS